jgi:3-deoxy-D-manno-octulosonic-acid transferase
VNFQDIFDRMAKAEAVTIVTEAELAPAIDRLLADPQRAADRAKAFARSEAGGILDRIVMALDSVVSGKSRSLGDR